MVSIQCNGLADTEDLATFVASLLKDGDVLALEGDLGAGKTFFVQQITKVLAPDSEATSPTFTVLQVYEGTVEIHHFDLYRLESIEELEDIGFYEYTTYGISLIEWPDQFREALPSNYLWITIEKGAGEEERIFQFQPQGKRYEFLCEELKHFANPSS
ncbi:MAG: tRNA (adenosine(37)-N6)-threonylcarbamoyltransferase complex ATPase subunit type 1 TsaE [Sporomusaceae bacterium]|nr:tRNA (adenosine(37)-N6)-threonylcarbamoyltransferase complex ATPase subunit type 1 TsaE [Sporomusaceae bacterium]